MDCHALCDSWPRSLVWITAACGIAFFLWSMWRVNRMDNEFRIVDLLLEGDPPRASVNKLTLLVFAAMAVWVTVLAALENKADPNVVNLILGVLGIFVVGRAANQAVARFSERRQLAPEQEPADDDERAPARPKRSLIK
jgi:uncharacterized membrane-anchored protein